MGYKSIILCWIYYFDTSMERKEPPLYEPPLCEALYEVFSLLSSFKDVYRV